MTQIVKAKIKQGHRVASGQADDSPYPLGSIEMQLPHFKKHGIDLEKYYKATLNLSIAPYTFELVSPEFTLNNVHWAKGFAAEDFSFSKCEIIFEGKSYSGLIYYPHPATKIGHFHDESLVEVIAEYIPNSQYGDLVELKYKEKEVKLRKKNNTQ